MNILEYLYSFFRDNIAFLILLLLTVLGFLLRVYFMCSGTWEHSHKTASKKLTRIILIMIILALCLEADFLHINMDTSNIIGGLVATVYLVIAFLSSFDRDNPENNSWVCFVKFFLVYLLAISSNVAMVFVSVIFAIGMINLYRKGFVGKDYDKIACAEIILLCIENFLISLAIFFIDIEDLYSTIVKVVFEETVLYSANYIVLFVVKEKLYAL